jgi:molybdenum cofactor synthesis domain-containing protein
MRVVFRAWHHLRMAKRSDKDLLRARFTAADPLRVLVITLSDRASSGVYEDKSGPKLRGHVEAHFEGTGIAVDIESALLTDDAETLGERLVLARDGGTHIVFTTGGTGLGSRDNTPDVVLDLADRTIPGIMDLVRLKYGADKPCALISRSVAAVLGRTVVYVLPGSRKAVDEYMEEILKSLDHVIGTVHDLDVH